MRLQAGCVLQTFGAGNAPTTDAFLQPFKEAIERGVLIINITQCPMGVVYPYYAVGKVRYFTFIGVGLTCRHCLILA